MILFDKDSDIKILFNNTTPIIPNTFNFNKAKILFNLTNILPVLV